MRKVVAGLFITPDGAVESPEKWQFDYLDAGVMAAMLCGRYLNATSRAE